MWRVWSKSAFQAGCPIEQFTIIAFQNLPIDVSKLHKIGQLAKIVKCSVGRLTKLASFLDHFVPFEFLFYVPTDSFEISGPQNSSVDNSE